jgi:hypothetical protein
MDIMLQLLQLPQLLPLSLQVFQLDKEYKLILMTLLYHLDKDWMQDIKITIMNLQMLMVIHLMQLQDNMTFFTILDKQLLKELKEKEELYIDKGLILMPNLSNQDQEEQLGNLNMRNQLQPVIDLKQPEDLILLVAQDHELKPHHKENQLTEIEDMKQHYDHKIN